MEPLVGLGFPVLLCCAGLASWSLPLKAGSLRSAPEFWSEDVRVDGGRGEA